MPRVTGGCYCGNIHLEADFPGELLSYNPRACDCDFCRKHGASYVSDPRGSLQIQVKDERNLSRFQQGSNTAQMLICRLCGVLVGAICPDADQWFGTVNLRALSSRSSFGPELPVSPRTLSKSQKIERWRGIWFPRVTIGSWDGSVSAG